MAGLVVMAERQGAGLLVIAERQGAGLLARTLPVWARLRLERQRGLPHSLE